MFASKHPRSPPLRTPHPRCFHAPPPSPLLEACADFALALAEFNYSRTQVYEECSLGTSEEDIIVALEHNRAVRSRCEVSAEHMLSIESQSSGELADRHQMTSDYLARTNETTF